MKTRAAVWQENWRTWAAPLSLAALGAVALIVYQVRYAGRVAALDARLDETRAALATAAAQRAELALAVERAEVNRQGVRELYAGRLGTERERLTRMITEVKGLAARSGMRPDAISYPREEIKDYGLLKKSVVFSVNGTYGGLRQLINFLELSSSFLTLEQVSLGDAGADGSLGIRLQIAALFVDERPRPERRAAPRATPPAPAAAPRPALRNEDGP